MQRKRAESRGGFTLIEMMIVVVIIAILATVAIVAYTRHLKGSRLVDAKAFISAIQGRQEMYLQNYGYYCNASGGLNWYPTTAEALAKPWSSPGPNLWGDLGARPESGNSYFQFLVAASTPPAPCSGGSCPTGHTVTTGTEGKLSICGAVDVITCSGQPWYYVIGRADLDGKESGTCGTASPWTPASETDCTFLWATSARSEIVVGSEGK